MSARRGSERSFDSERQVSGHGFRICDSPRRLCEGDREILHIFPNPFSSKRPAGKSDIPTQKHPIGTSNQCSRSVSVKAAWVCSNASDSPIVLEIGAMTKIAAFSSRVRRNPYRGPRLQRSAHLQKHCLGRGENQEQNRECPDRPVAAGDSGPVVWALISDPTRKPEPRSGTHC